MKLRTKVGWVVVLVFSSILAVGFLLTHRLLLPEFKAIEGEGAHRDVLRLRAAFRTELDHVADLGLAWQPPADAVPTAGAALPGTKPSAAVPASTGDAPPFEAALEGALDLVADYDRDGTVVRRWASPGLVDLAGVPRLLAGGRLTPDDPLLASLSHDGPTNGMLPTRTGALLLSSRASPPAAPGEPSPGIRVVGRILDRESLGRMGHRILVDFEAWPPDAPGLSPDMADRALEGGETRLERVKEFETRVESFGTIPGLDGRPALMFRVDSPRGLWARGGFVLDAAAVILTVAGLLIGILIYLMIRAIVVAPLSDLTLHMTKVGRLGDLSARLDSQRRDEIGVLALEFDRMMERLESAQGRVAEVSHVSGMALISRNVIHNLGNALNSVGVTVQGMTERARMQRGPALDRVVDALRDHDKDLNRFLSDEEQGQKLLSYLAKLAAQIHRDDDVLATDLAALHQNLIHMNEIIQAHRKLAKKDGAQYEQVTLQRLASLSLHMVASTLNRHEIRVLREFEDTPPLWLERVRFVEVLVNLLTNAKEACLQAHQKEPVIHVRTHRGPEERICISVRDNGIGMVPEKIRTLFEGGYTTKGAGRGQGLLFCARAIEEMGGTLQAASEGPGTGSVLTISFPRDLAERPVPTEPLAPAT